MKSAKDSELVSGYGIGYRGFLTYNSVEANSLIMRELRRDVLEILSLAVITGTSVEFHMRLCLSRSFGERGYWPVVTFEFGLYSPNSCCS